MIFLFLLACTLCAVAAWALAARTKKEQFSGGTCSMSREQLDDLYASAERIKATMDALRDYPWPDRQAFQYLYTYMVTRVRYLLDTYGQSITFAHFLNMELDVLMFRTHMEFRQKYGGLLGDAFAEYDAISTAIMSFDSLTSCPACDPTFILQGLNRVDAEFGRYFAHVFGGKDELPQSSVKRLLRLEVDFLAVSDLVERAMQRQRLDAHGRLDITDAEQKLHEVHSEFLVLSADVDLYMASGQALDDVATYVEMKRIVLADLKLCVVTPMAYALCGFHGKPAVLLEGEYTSPELLQNHGLKEVGSLRIPPSHNVIAYFEDGSVSMYSGDVQCIEQSKRKALRRITVSKRP